MGTKSNQKNVLILFFTLIVVMLGFGMIIPIMPFYVKSFGASGSALGALMATYGVLQFIFAPIWGGLSDRIGRKPVIMIGVLGNAISQLLFGFSTQLWMLFAARALSGMLSVATLPTAMAYIGDSTDKEGRSKGMGMVGAAMGIGMVLGPGLGGILAKESLSIPFFMASGLSVIALLLIFMFLPEPIRSASDKEPQPTSAQFKEMGKALSSPLGVLFIVSFLVSFGLANFESVFGLYASDRYQYSPGRVGLVLTMIGLISAVMQGLLTGPVNRRFGEQRVIQACLLSSGIGFILMTHARTFTEVLLSVSFFMISNSLLNPTVATLISKDAAAGQGITMGINNSFLSLGRIAGPLWAGNVYDIRMNMPYSSGAAVMFVGFLFSLRKLSGKEKVQDFIENL